MPQVLGCRTVEVCWTTVGGSIGADATTGARTSRIQAFATANLISRFVSWPAESQRFHMRVSCSGGDMHVSLSSNVFSCPEAHIPSARARIERPEEAGSGFDGGCDGEQIMLFITHRSIDPSLPPSLPSGSHPLFLPPPPCPPSPVCQAPSKTLRHIPTHISVDYKKVRSRDMKCVSGR